MEPNFKARTVGAIVTVLALALILPNILHTKKDAGFESQIPAKPSTPSWVDEGENNRVKIELQELASGELQRQIAPAEPRIVETDEPAPVALDPNKSTLDAGGSVVAWTLQVGAFNNTQNATKLRDTLRSEGFKAYLIKNSKTQLDHVYVGPMLQRAKAEEARAQLVLEMSLDGIRLQQYKPE